ncbi:MAG: TetR/AcrR family transcriptional regulator [Spirochaetaceae bacterium]
MDGHQIRRNNIENRIMRTAMHLFKTYGFKSVSIEKIAAESKVSKVTIYKYFTNKESLVHTSLKTMFTSKADELKKIITSNILFEKKLELLIKSKIDIFQSFSGDLLHELEQITPKFVDELMTLRRESIIALSNQLLNEGRNDGYISSEISNESFTVFFDIVGMGMINSPSFKKYLEVNPKAFEEIQKLAMSCLNISHLPNI